MRATQRLLFGAAVLGVSAAWLGTSISGQSSGAASLPAGIDFRSIGPVNTSGRVDDFAVARIPGKPDAIYVGTASGGVFKSVNGGTSWTPVFDHVDAMMSIGDVAVAPSNPHIVWAGTGEANNRQSSSWGDGVYKSTDDGATWTSMGLKDTKSIGRIVIDPTNADVVYVAAVGHLWGPNAERGVFKTTDGGSSWKKVLFVDDNTGANDLVIDAHNPKVLIAAMYQRQRREWGFNGGGPGSGIYKTTDAGATWHKVTQGLPAGDKGRMGLDMFAGDGSVVLATVEAANPARGGDATAVAAPGGGQGRGGRGGNNGAPEVLTGGSGVYASSDAGESWHQITNLDTRPSYYSQIRIDPKDKSRVYTLGSNRGFYVSDDGGKTFIDKGTSGVHGEDHALWVDPDNTNHLIVGGDGGVSISWDRGLTWDFRMNMPIGQFYEIDVDDKVPFTVCGGLQDNGEWCVPSATRDRNGISAVDGWNIGGGDGFYVKFDRADMNYAYAESQNGGAGRVNLKTMARENARPAGQGLKWNWDTPIIVSSHDPKVVYMGAQMLYRSPDEGRTWTAISPDLSAQIDPATLSMMGGPIPPTALSRNDGSSPYGSITTIGESPSDAKVLYVGVDDGTLQMTRDGGTTWTNITSHVTGLPAHTYVSSVIPSKYAPGRVYATFDGHYNDDYKPYVYVSEDFGQSWRAIVNGLPETSVNRLREHPRNPHLLVVGHERGASVSTDDGRTWIGLSRVTNLPNVPVDDIAIQPRDNALVLGTHGRSIWILDDMAAIELMTPDAIAQDAVLATIPPAYEMVTHSPQAWFGTGTFFAPNPAFDATFTYSLKSAATGDATITIADRSGAVVRTLTGPVLKGVNRVRWDLRGEAPAADATPPAAGQRGGAGGRGAGAGRGAGGGGRGGGPNGPAVAPGTYTVTIKIPGVSRDLVGQILVEADPLSKS